jgi:hypothetical protein
MRISKVWIDDHSVYATTTDGLTASYDFSHWPRLRDASPEQRAQFELSYSGIHWPAIDEDLSFEGMFHAACLCDTSENEDNVCYVSIS